MRASKPSASSTNGGAGHELGAERRPQAAGQAAGGAGHRHAARVARQPAGESAGARSAARPRPRRRPSAARRRSAACSNGVRTSHSTTSRRRAGRRRPRSPRSRPAPPSVVALPPTATSTTCGARRPRRPTISSPVPAVRRRLGVALVLGHEPEPARLRHLDDRGAAVVEQPEAGVDRPAERVVDARRRRLAAEREQQHLHRPLAAVGERAAGRRQPARGARARGRSPPRPRSRGTCP